MVDEYNKMLENLEDSKRALAISEKESAWREMARQVAHEIKNPLTPMKLTLQHLERILKEKISEDKRFDKPIKTLLYQIETLDDIATTFGTFANMPIPEIERFELTSLLRKTFGLYKNIKSGTVKLFGENGDIYVFGDEQLIGRVFSNILINSIQSVPEGKEAQIKGEIKINGKDKVLVSIQDNGNGIPENIKDKIFVPNFSTKSGGSGIGLAIAKRGIEHAGGKIWFETEEGIGTKFFVELPSAS
jgi:nitrogen fixation/metabolism regulation signal transduction histidine kinase